MKFIVIGAGILGASTAYHLSKAGADVIVIDRKDKGQATDAAAGIVCPWLSQRRNKAWYGLAKKGAAFYPGLIRELEEAGEKSTGYARTGTISIHQDHEKLLAMEDRAHQRREDAPEIGEIRVLSPEETKELFPPLAEGWGSVHVSGAARVNGRDLRDALLRSAQRLGAHVLYENAEFKTDSSGAVTGVTAESGFYQADKIIVTAGAWTLQLLKEIGVDFRVKDLKAQIVHMELPGEETGNWPVVMPPGNQYIVPFADGRIAAGATYENFTNFDLRVTAGGVREILQKAMDIAPGLADSTILETRVGFRPYTPGSLPAIGVLPGFDNVLIGNGLGATGLTVGPYVGLELANVAMGLDGGIDLDTYNLEEALKKG